MRTIEDVLGLIDGIIDDVMKTYGIQNPSCEIKRRLNLFKEELKKESQMEPKQNVVITQGALDNQPKFTITTTTPKPFDIDRCLNEDGGRCIWFDEEVILLSKKIGENNSTCIWREKHKTYSVVSVDINLQNIPRRKERWINVWRFKDSNELAWTIKPGYSTKERALDHRKYFESHDYIGEPICISSEEV